MKPQQYQSAIHNVSLGESIIQSQSQRPSSKLSMNEKHKASQVSTRRGAMDFLEGLEREVASQIKT